ncbi:unnamed protein product [Darwinula stevensoni]|uniref:Nuclear inhibitor of protein phosphatase 1 n=1 Tax=Darwinula stevensoni TaxID=69355 RepID=A0A7R8XAS3_9CRUS|nr:unnamed protein product [Darwinula stevensoni]CAG0885835.1 unnamed protein product [Darwinula stevensoni]
MANHYEIPDWAGKPPVGLHLDVLKGDKLIQKLMIDEKKCYLFGRNPHLNDFCIDHASCSRVHATLVYHKNLDRAFLVDLDSTHGTFIGHVRLEPKKPTPLPIDSQFHFGASSRLYILRARPQTAQKPIMEELERSSEEAHGDLLGLPETEMELDNLTEFNTAHNRRITMLRLEEDLQKVRKRKNKFVTFNDEEEVINPEDLDPNVGRFRNLVQTTVIPLKKMKGDGLTAESGMKALGTHPHHRPLTSPSSGGLYHDIPPASHSTSLGLFTSALGAKLGLPLPNPAPDVEIDLTPAPQISAMLPEMPVVGEEEPRKKKYAKEAWPGKKSMPALL